ncbi:hypothetical protein I546_2635 [Mycobacterium kansasii 732]|nr:hypothetical protein I546_2635 [Mycobacterium kansasii 732]
MFNDQISAPSAAVTPAIAQPCEGPGRTSFENNPAHIREMAPDSVAGAYLLLAG